MSVATVFRSPRTTNVADPHVRACRSGPQHCSGRGRATIDLSGRLIWAVNLAESAASLMKGQMSSARAPVGVLGNGLQVDVLVQLHVLRVDPDHLQPTGLVRHAHVDLAVEPPESAQRRAVSAPCCYILQCSIGKLSRRARHNLAVKFNRHVDLKASDS